MGLVSPLQKVTCPHCFERFHLSRAPHRLLGRGVPTEPDLAIAKHFGIPARPLNKVDYSPTEGSFWRRLGRRFYLPPEPSDARKICPGCHIFLPDKMASGEMSGEVFAIVGARSSGKSNYFGVLLRELRKKQGPSVGFELLDATTYSPSRGPISSSQLYDDRYGNALYHPTEPRAVGQTKSVLTTLGTDNDPRIPLIYLLRFPKRSWHILTRPFSNRIPVYLMIFDMAGEDTGDQQVMELYCRFLERATGIIFLIDPFEYTGIRKRLPAEIRQQFKPVNADPAAVVDRVASVIRSRRHLSAGRPIPLPAAFVLTKSDLFEQIEGVVYKRSPISRESVHRRGYDQAGGEELSREVKQHIINWDSAELVDKARDNFQTNSFFAVSALGAAPDAATLRLQQELAPKRVADPLLWLFWQLSYIPATRHA